MKHFVAVCVLLFLSLSISTAAPFDCVVKAYPQQLHLNWSSVAEADYYDIYVDRTPKARIRDATGAQIGSPEDPLLSDHPYEVLIVARKEGDIQLVMSRIETRTTARYHDSCEIIDVYPAPNHFSLYWSEIESASHYDLYLDGRAYRRYTDTYTATVGSNDEPLASHRAYEVMVVARSGDDTVLGLATTAVSTSGWEGEYRWENETKKDNKGRARELRFRVTYTGSEYRVEGYYDRWYTIYPIVAPAQVGETFSFSGTLEVEQAYRANALTFNTSSIRPDRWKITRMEGTAAHLFVEAESKAKGITATTRTDFRFLVSAEGKRELHFETTAGGIAGMWIFRSPNPGDNGVFRAVSY